MSCLIKYRVKGSDDDWSYYEDASLQRCQDYLQMCEFAEDIEYQSYVSREKGIIVGIEGLTNEAILIQDLVGFGQEGVPIKLKSLCNSSGIKKHCDSWTQYGAFHKGYYGGYVQFDMKDSTMGVFFVTPKYIRPPEGSNRDFDINEDLDVYITYIAIEGKNIPRNATFINSEYCCSMHEFPHTIKIDRKLF